MMMLTAMNLTFNILIVLIFLFLILHCRHNTYAAAALVAADPPLSPPPVACSNELVTFSTCLPYVAVSPNNISESPPQQCCDDISAAFAARSASCLCYFVRQPNILGFPLDSTKVLSLTSVCPMSDRSYGANFSLETLCSGSAALPPLRSITGPSNMQPRNSSAYSPPPPPPLTESPEEPNGSSLTPNPSDESPSQPSFSTIPAGTFSATERIIKLSWTLLLSFPVYIFTSV